MPDLWLKTPGPECPKRCGGEGTPVRYPWGEVNEDRWDGPRNANLKCPCCGHGWVGTDAEVAQANASLRAYDEAQGYPWPEAHRKPAKLPDTTVAGPVQLELFPEVSRG